MHLACQSVLGRQVAVNRRHFYGEDAVRRGSPQHAMPVVGDIGYLVGAEAISLGQGIQGAVMVVGDDEAMVLLDLYLQSAIQVLRLGDVFK